MAAFYNDNERYVAAWLRNLVAAGHLPAGNVDERSILDIERADLADYRQCHFFAGIGGWPRALALAGWPEEREVWSASCPCQPLSSAGRRQGHADERHLWPAFYRLVAECRPATIFGEQVSSADGREWLSGIRADLEYLGYAVGAADLPAAGVAAPHIRQRLFWVAQRMGESENERHCWSAPTGRQTERGLEQRGPTGGVADAGRERAWGEGSRAIAGAPHGAEGEAQQRQRLWPDADAGSTVAGGLADADEMRSRWWSEDRGREAGSGSAGSSRWVGDTASEQMGRTRQPWQDSVWLPCLDGKARRVESSIEPLAHGVSNRVGRLRAYGNAIVPLLAAEFIRAFMEIE